MPLEAGRSTVRLSFLVILAACIGLASCTPTVDPDVDATARKAYRQIRDNDPGLSALLAPELKTPEAMAAFPRVQSYLPKEEPKAVVAIQWTTYYPNNDNDVTAHVRHAYRFEGKRAVVTTTLRRRPATRDWKVSGFKISVASENDLSENRLTLAGKSLAHYAFLAAMILSPALIVASIIRLVVIKGRRERLLWILPALIGVCSLKMNWTTGAVTFHPVNFELLGVGATTIPTGFDPWTMSVSFPLVAILILLGVVGRRRPRTTPADS